MNTKGDNFTKFLPPKKQFAIDVDRVFAGSEKEKWWRIRTVFSKRVFAECPPVPSEERMHFFPSKRQRIL